MMMKFLVTRRSVYVYVTVYVYVYLLSLCNALSSSLSSSRSPPPPGPILVVGATGGTGLRALEGLLDAGYKPQDIRILSRNIDRPSVVALRESMGFTTVQADLDLDEDLNENENYKCLESAMEGCVGAYIHSTSSDTKKLDTCEERRAENLARAMSKKGSTIRHVVYNSAVGEPGHGVERIAQKHAVEDVFVKMCVAGTYNDNDDDVVDDDGGVSVSFSFTSLRANFFMEELWKSYTRPGILNGKFSFSVPAEREMYLTSVRDMGHLAGECLRSQTEDKEKGKGSKGNRCRVIHVAGDKLSVADMAKAFAKAQGSPCVHSKNRVLAFIARLFFRELYQIIRFYRTSTEVTDMDELKEEFPNVGLTSFPQFLEETHWGNPDLTYEDLNIVKNIEERKV